jgi:Enoyl-(Acyl carrier protein) reductase
VTPVPAGSSTSLPRLPARADAECRAPVLEGEGPGDGDGELAVRGVLRELAEHVVTQCRVLVEGVADAKFGGGGEVADGQDAAGIASGRLDEAGQHAADRRGVQDQVHWPAARELAHLGVTANAINPGPVDTGWMSGDLKQDVVRQTPLGRLGTPQDTAHLVEFLCSPKGGWINGQLLLSNGGFG